MRIGLTGKYPPFNFFDKDGKLTGFDVDVSRHICKKLEHSCKFVILQWDGILAALLADKIDLIVGSMAITPEREKQALFSIPYYESGAQIFAQNPKQNVEALNFKIGVTLGTTYEAVVRKHLPNALVKTYKGDTEILQDIRAGRLNAIVSDRLVGAYMIRNFGVDLTPIGQPLYLERMGIPSRPSEKALIKQVNSAVTSLRKSSQYEQLIEKYFGLVGRSVGHPALPPF